MTVTPQPGASLCAEMAHGAPVTVGANITARQFDNLTTPPPAGASQPLQLSALFTSGGLFTIITLSGNPPASTFLHRWETVWRDTLASYRSGHGPADIPSMRLTASHLSRREIRSPHGVLFREHSVTLGARTRVQDEGHTMKGKRQPASATTLLAGRAPRVRRRVKLAARALLALFALACLIVAFSPIGRATTRAAFLLPALITGEEPGAFYTLGEPISHTSQVIASRDGPVYLDIYAPISPTPLIPGAREGLVVIPGVGDNRTVPQLVNLMQSLARSGVVAVEMTTNTLMDYDLAQATS